MKKLHFLVVDDNEIVAKAHAGLLEQAGHQVTVATTGTQALNIVKKVRLDCILCDLLIPDLDGVELYRHIQKIPDIKPPIFIIITAKVFEFDRRNILALGVDGYLLKPINPGSFIDTIMTIIKGTIEVHFWGVRGTLPVPGKKTNIFGGNTNCVTLCIAKKYFLIFDAGSGIKELSNHLLSQNQFPIAAKIFISHPHFDHINSLPFFAPLYMKGNEFDIYGSAHGEISIEKLIAGQMDNAYFPITIKEFAAKLTFRDLGEETLTFDDLQVKTILLNHPGRCLGFRVDYKNKSFCYITDNELYLKNSPQYDPFEEDRLVNFIQGAEIVVIDSTYTDEEYKGKIGWGHSCISRVVEVADKAKVKKLCLYHHDPDQFDKEIHLKLKTAKELLKKLGSKTRCIAPRENDQICI